MDNARKDQPLHKTLHYRKLRNLLQLLASAEKINLDNYDVFKMTAYRCHGETLKGRNVTCKVRAGSDCNPFVGNNNYEVIEIPSKNNFYKFTGDFLMLVHDTDFDYWMLLKMRHRINYQKTKELNKLIETINFIPQGKYSVSYNANNEIFVSKEEKGYNCSFGGNSHRFNYFDQMNIRKQAYLVNIQEEINKICKRRTEVKGNFIDNKAVEIYKKKKKNL